MSNTAKKQDNSNGGLQGDALRESGDLKVISLENLTSRCRIEKGTRYVGDGRPDHQKEPQTLSVSSIRAGGVVLDVPKAFCSGGHKLNAVFNFFDGVREFEFKVTCLVEEAQHENGFPDRVELQFQVFDATAWELVLSFYGDRQSKVTDLFAKLRGWKE